MEHKPEPWEIVFPGECDARIRLSVDEFRDGGRLRMVFREEHLPGAAVMFPKDWQGFFRDWNRRTGSRLARTVIVRKAAE